MIILSASAMLFYAIALILVTSRLFHVDGPNRRLVSIFGATGVLLHAGALFIAIFTSDGQNFSITNVMSLVCWIIALAVNIVLPRIKVIVIVPVVYSCAIISVSLLWLVPPEYIVNFTENPGLLIHIILSLLAYSALIIAALYALQLNSIQKKLKSKQFNATLNMPPLMTVEKQLYHLVMIGVILLSMALATGFITLEDILKPGMIHKAVLSILAWFVYIAMLWQQYSIGCRVKTAVIYTITGAVLLSFAYFGARIVKELILT